MCKAFLLLVVMLVGTGCQTMLDRLHALEDVPCPRSVDSTPGAMCKRVMVPVPNAGNFLMNTSIAKQYVDLHEGIPSGDSAVDNDRSEDVPDFSALKNMDGEDAN